MASKIYWTSSKIAQAKREAKNYGMDYVNDKYGSSNVSRINKTLSRNLGMSPGRSEAYGKRSILNAPPKAREGQWLTDGARIGFQDGGEMAVTDNFPAGTFQPQMQLNLENDSALSQGSHHRWAQPTSISSTITSLLRESQNASPNYWAQWSNSQTGGQYALDGRGSSEFGVDMRYTTQSALNNNMGAFGIAPLYQEEGEEGPLSENPNLGGASTTTDTNAGTGLPNYNPGDAGYDPENPPENGLYNPWSFGKGGQNNSYGPSSEHMSNATMESLALANAYFAPQRMELAYELGDMETDMRRLATSLGRQVDDPVLQAKLYKEAQRATRTLDVQQNTFAFQMAEQRRREEMQNFQFYDQLGQEEYRLRLANQQFYRNLDLQQRYYNLQNYQVSNFNPTGPGPQQPAPGAESDVAQGGNLVGGLYNAMMNPYQGPYNPYYGVR